jgi:large subunit ribosomal protein L25
MKPFELNAEPRQDKGRAASRRMRREGKVPTVMYGGNGDPVMLTVDRDDLEHHLENEAFYSHINKINVKGSSAEDAVLRDLQRHPAKGLVQHMDLLRIVAGEAIRMNVPLHFINEETCPGVKDEGGIIQHNMNDIEIECLPRNLPEYIEVDCAGMHLHDAIHMSEITVPEGVELVELLHQDIDRTVVSVQVPRAALELEAEEEAEAEAEAAEALEDPDAGDADEADGEAGEDAEGDDDSKE